MKFSKQTISKYSAEVDGIVVGWIEKESSFYRVDYTKSFRGDVEYVKSFNEAKAKMKELHEFWTAD